MFEINGLGCEEHDMELNSIDSANFDAMVAEEAIIDWLIDLETEDTDFELSSQQADQQAEHRRQAAH